MSAFNMDPNNIQGMLKVTQVCNETYGHENTTSALVVVNAMMHQFNRLPVETRQAIIGPVATMLPQFMKIITAQFNARVMTPFEYSPN